MAKKKKTKKKKREVERPARPPVAKTAQDPRIIPLEVEWRADGDCVAYKIREDGNIIVTQQQKNKSWVRLDTHSEPTAGISAQITDYYQSQLSKKTKQEEPAGPETQTDLEGKVATYKVTRVRHKSSGLVIPKLTRTQTNEVLGLYIPTNEFRDGRRIFRRYVKGKPGQKYMLAPEAAALVIKEYNAIRKDEARRKQPGANDSDTGEPTEPQKSKEPKSADELDSILADLDSDRVPTKPKEKKPIIESKPIQPKEKRKPSPNVDAILSKLSRTFQEMRDNPNPDASVQFEDLDAFAEEVTNFRRAYAEPFTEGQKEKYEQLSKAVMHDLESTKLEAEASEETEGAPEVEAPEAEEPAEGDKADNQVVRNISERYQELKKKGENITIKDYTQLKAIIVDAQKNTKLTPEDEEKLDDIYDSVAEDLNALCIYYIEKEKEVIKKQEELAKKEEELEKIIKEDRARIEKLERKDEKEPEDIKFKYEIKAVGTQDKGTVIRYLANGTETEAQIREKGWYNLDKKRYLSDKERQQLKAALENQGFLIHALEERIKPEHSVCSGRLANKEMINRWGSSNYIEFKMRTRTGTFTYCVIPQFDNLGNVTDYVRLKDKKSIGNVPKEIDDLAIKKSRFFK